MSQDVMERKDQRSRDREPVREQPRTQQAQPKPERSRLFLVLVVFAILLLVIGGITLVMRRSQYQALAKETETLAVPTVSVVHPIAGSHSVDLGLPSTLQAYVESPIYARTNGYLKKWNHDSGSRVNQGQLLAEIDTP